ncbi:MAG: hypothetical protein M3R09_10905 [Actinomycetota bacterium]|nr:hypothetical protein [Actinomycetota bacterium]
MNVRSIEGAEQVICIALGLNRLPASIAVALDASAWLNTAEVQAELTRLRLLQNAQPAELTEVQTEALVDAGNRALGDFYHERACSCSTWPDECATNPAYPNGFWDTDAFAVGMAAVLGVWESMRAPVEADQLHQRIEHQREGKARWRARAETAESRVAELEAERHETNQVLSDAAERLRADRDRIAELEAERGHPAPMLASRFDSREADEYRHCGGDLGRMEYPFTCHRRIAHEGPCSGEYDAPHEGPEEHFYRLGRDLPEVPRG